MSSTANGAPLLSAVLTIPRIGPWHTDIDVAATDPAILAAPVTLSLVDGAIAFVGAAWRPPAAWRDTVRARLVGGAAGLRTELEPGAYAIATIRTVLTDILRGSGEELSPAIAEGLLDTDLDQWVRLGSSAGAALQSLADEFDLAWRVLPDGTVWIGAETWPDAAAFEYVVLDRSVEGGRMVLGVEEPLLLPGTVFEGERVGRVVHRLEPERIRTDVYFE